MSKPRIRRRYTADTVELSVNTYAVLLPTGALIVVRHGAALVLDGAEAERLRLALEGRGE